MIDHISVAVRDLVIAERFYTAVLTPLGLFKVRNLPDAAIGFGKRYPEFWINKREAMAPVADDSGVHNRRGAVGINLSAHSSTPRFAIEPPVSPLEGSPGSRVQIRTLASATTPNWEARSMRRGSKFAKGVYS